MSVECGTGPVVSRVETDPSPWTLGQRYSPWVRRTVPVPPILVPESQPVSTRTHDQGSRWST